MDKNYSVVTRERKDGVKYAVIDKDGKIVCYTEEETPVNAENIAGALNYFEEKQIEKSWQDVMVDEQKRLEKKFLDRKDNW